MVVKITGINGITNKQGNKNKIIIGNINSTRVKNKQTKNTKFARM